MNNSPKKAGPDTDLRGLLKHHHKVVYSICRLFANNYKEHQRLFVQIIAAASQNIRSAKERSDKHALILRACLNMAALHSIRLDLEPENDRTLQFKSPDFQRIMTQLRESVGEVPDAEKFRLFLELEKVPSDEMAELTGMTAAGNDHNRIAVTVGPTAANGRTSAPGGKPKKNFIPYLKEKLIWS
jgi:hypothetical protein